MSATIGRGCCVWRPSVLRNGGAVNGKRKLAPAGAPNLLNACFFRENHYWKSLVSNATAPANSGANEELVADAVREHRGDYVIASKFGNLGLLGDRASPTA